MIFGTSVSGTHSIPTYGTQSIPIYGSSINPSINYGLNTPSLAQPNYGTTSIPVNYVHIPAAIPINKNGAIYSVIKPRMSNASLIQNSQLSIPCVPTSLVIPTKNDNPHLVRNYPIDERDPRRLPRYSTFIPMMNGSDYGDVKARTILPFNLVYPLLNQNTPIQVSNGVIPRMNDNLPITNTGFGYGMYNTGNYLNNQVGNVGIGLNNINPTVNNINNTTNNLNPGMNNFGNEINNTTNNLNPGSNNIGSEINNTTNNLNPGSNNIGSEIKNITSTANKIDSGVNTVGRGINKLSYATTGNSNTAAGVITSKTRNLTSGVNYLGHGVGGLANTANDLNNLKNGIEPIDSPEAAANAAKKVGKELDYTANNIVAAKRGIRTIKNLF